MHFQFNLLVVVRTQRLCASTKGVYTARDRWSKHQYLKYLPRPSRACFNVTKCEQNITEVSWEGQPNLETALLPNWWPLVKPCVKSSASLRIVLVKGAGPWVNCGKNETSCICPGHCECSPTQWLKYDGWIYNKFNPWYSMIMKCPHCTAAESQSIAAGKPKGHSSGCVMQVYSIWIVAINGDNLFLFQSFCMLLCNSTFWIIIRRLPTWTQIWKGPHIIQNCIIERHIIVLVSHVSKHWCYHGFPGHQGSCWRSHTLLARHNMD